MVRWITRFLSESHPRWQVFLIIFIFTYVPGMTSFSRQGINLAIETGTMGVQGVTQFVGGVLR